MNKKLNNMESKSERIESFFYKMYWPIFMMGLVILCFFIAIVVSRAYDKGFHDGIEMMVRQQQEEDEMTDYEIEMRGGDPSPTQHNFETETL